MTDTEKAVARAEKELAVLHEVQKDANRSFPVAVNMVQLWEGVPSFLPLPRKRKSNLYFLFLFFIFNTELKWPSRPR